MSGSDGVRFFLQVSGSMRGIHLVGSMEMPEELSREEMEQILDAVPDRIFRLDHNFRVQYRNLSATRGLPLIELGMNMDEFSVPPSHRARWRSGLQRALFSGVAERFDLEVVGAHRYDVSLVPLTHENAPSVVVVMRDITERVREQNQTLQQLTHDLNNILMSTLTGCEVLRRAGGPPDAEQAVDRIVLSARRGADIISQLRTLWIGRKD